MKKKLLVISILCIMILNVMAVPSFAAIANPYGTTATGCITSIEMKSSTTLRNDVTYFTSSVTSLKAGTGSARPFNTYGAIGGEKTRMFVYSMGKNSNTDFTTKPVKTLMEQFAAENPDWIPLVAINGDFFDIESSNTAGIGEPENVMIQNGSILKGHPLEGVAGSGIIGTKLDGSVVYSINGFSTADGVVAYSYAKHNTYGTLYNLTVYNSNKTATLEEYTRLPAGAPTAAKPTFVTPNSSATDLTGYTVYVVSCDSYRYAYRGGSGKVDSQGDYTYFVSGKITSTRAGTAGEKPSAGQVYIAIDPSTETSLAVGNCVRINTSISSAQWKDVYNAVGFKQAVLVNGDSSFVKGLTSSSSDTTKVADISYSVYNANRSAIGFRPDGTPVVLAIAKTGDYGATYYEIAEQLKALGCTYGFVLDGGGSTTMTIRNNDGTFSNVFVGENGNTGRSVGNAIILAVPKDPNANPGGDTTTEKPTDKPTEDNTTTKPVEPDLNNTFVSIDKGNGYVAHSSSEPEMVDGKLNITGYAGFTQSIVNSGYYFDNNKDTVKWNSSFLAAGDDAAKAAAGDKAMNFNISVDLSSLSAGKHKVNFMLKLADGTFVIIKSATITVGNVPYFGVANVDSYVAHSASKPTDTTDKLSLTGYAGFTQNIVNSGYYFDNDSENIRWNSKFLAVADDATKEIAGDKAMSFNFEVDIPDLDAGEHKIHFMLKLADGSFVLVDTVAFTVPSSEPVPAPSKSSGCGSGIGGIGAILITIAAVPFIARKKRK